MRGEMKRRESERTTSDYFKTKRFWQNLRETRLKRTKTQTLCTYRIPLTKYVLDSTVALFDIVIISLSPSLFGSCDIHVTVSQHLTARPGLRRSQSLALLSKCLQPSNH